MRPRSPRSPPAVRIPAPALPLAAGLLAAVLAAAAGAGAARADTLELKDGRVVEGAVEETPEGYRVRTRFGESVVPKGDVVTHNRGRTVDDLVRERLASL